MFDHTPRSLRKVVAVASTLLAVAAAAAGCGRGDDAASPDDQLIVGITGFSCGTNDYTNSLCNGWKAAAKDLPDGYRFEHKAGTDFTDQTALNNLIETTLQLKPAGIILFPSGPAAQVPILTKACEQGVKVFVLDNDMPKLTCKSSLIQTDNYEAGVKAAKWLIDHPPKSKEIGMVHQPNGAFASDDARREGFTKTVTDAGFKVVAEVTSQGDIEKTRGSVTDMLTAHPDLGTIFSTADFIGDGTTQALKATNRLDIVHLTVDGNLKSVVNIPDKGLTASVAQNPYAMSNTAVLNMAKLLEGDSVPKDVSVPTKVIDESNVAEYIKSDGRF